MLFKRTFAHSALQLFDFHLKHNAKMVDFAGWQMPLDYPNQTLLQSHLWTRKNASLFDVSHMLQSRFSGKHSTDFLESLVVADLKNLPVGASTLSVFTNDQGGIIDDTVINKMAPNDFYVVSNAGCADKDLKHINHHLDIFKGKGGDCSMQIIDKSLIALQGPKAAEVLERLSKTPLAKVPFMTAFPLTLDVNGASVSIHASRCGYTGEDGFELSIPHEHAEAIADLLVAEKEVEVCGLGARDSLRIEAGLCLYGTDIDDSIGPVEAGLAWTIGKSRRAEGGFLGAETILGVLNSKKPVSRRVGIVSRDGAPIFVGDEQVGHVTSGCPSPCLGGNVAMGYVKNGVHRKGTKVTLQVRGKKIDGEIVKMPFVESKYHRVE